MEYCSQYYLFVFNQVDFTFITGFALCTCRQLNFGTNNFTRALITFRRDPWILNTTIILGLIQIMELWDFFKIYSIMTTIILLQRPEYTLLMQHGLPGGSKILI